MLPAVSIAFILKYHQWYLARCVASNWVANYRSHAAF